MNIAQQKYADDDCNQAGLAGGRQSAKGVIRERVRHLRSEADRLEALAQSLPEVLPNMADDALYSLLAQARR